METSGKIRLEVSGQLPPFPDNMGHGGKRCWAGTWLLKLHQGSQRVRAPSLSGPSWGLWKGAGRELPWPALELGRPGSSVLAGAGHPWSHPCPRLGSSCSPRGPCGLGSTGGALRCGLRLGQGEGGTGEGVGLGTARQGELQPHLSPELVFSLIRRKTVAPTFTAGCGTLLQPAAPSYDWLCFLSLPLAGEEPTSKGGERRVLFIKNVLPLGLSWS